MSYEKHTDEELNNSYKYAEKRAMDYHKIMIDVANEKIRRAKAKQPDFKMTPTFTLEEIELARSMMEKSK